MEKNGEAWASIAKGAIAWIGLVMGHAMSSITLSGLALTVTTIYSALQIFVLVRDKIMRRNS